MLGIAQLLSMLLIAGTELLLQGQPFVLLQLLLLYDRQALLTERLSMCGRLPLKLRAISPGLYLPHHRRQQANADHP